LFPILVIKAGEGQLMDEIEAGFNKLIERLEEKKKEKKTLAGKIQQGDVALLTRMAKSAAPLISNIGLNMLKRGKQDTKGELYDTVFMRKKMIVLGKTDPSATLLDNPARKVDDQFCVFSEDGKFYELLYSFDGFLVESLLRPITPKQALSSYGIEIMVMLYHALHDYLKGEDELISALQTTLTYIYPEQFQK
jgi:hypothetical protein